MHLQLDGKVIFVAGGSRGIGLGIVEACLAEGAKLAIAARGAEALKVFEAGQGGRVVPPEAGDGYLGELGYMAECIERGRAPRHVTAEDGVSAVEICEAEEESIRTGRPVALK